MCGHSNNIYWQLCCGVVGYRYIKKKSLCLTQKGMKKKKLQKGIGKGGVNRTPPPPSIFKSIQPIHIKLGMCTKCPVYFQLDIVTWHLIGFHGNHNNIMTSLVTWAAILDFQIFQYFSYSYSNAESSEKTTFSDWNLQNCKIHCKVISI